jgi:hypothetical protein
MVRHIPIMWFRAGHVRDVWLLLPNLQEVAWLRHHSVAKHLDKKTQHAINENWTSKQVVFCVMNKTMEYIRIISGEQHGRLNS